MGQSNMITTYDRSTITHELGVKLESRYGKAWEHKNMSMVLRDLPMIAEEIESIWCDSNACADYTVCLRQPVSMERAKEIGRHLSKAFLRRVGGYNGIWVWVLLGGYWELAGALAMKITDAQIEAADGAFWAVWTSFADDRKAMRAALEAYERVRDTEQILRPESLAENDAQVERGLKNLHHKLQKDYPR